jgi:hypothetical protein
MFPITVGVGRVPVRLKQPDAEDQRQRSPAARGSEDSCPFSDRPDLPFDRTEALARGQIAFVEQYRVGIAQLVFRRPARKKIEAEIGGVGDRDDRVDAHPIAKLGAHEGQHDRQRVGEAGAFDDQVVDPLVSVQDPTDGIGEVVVQRATDAAVAELHHSVARGDDQLAVDPDFADLVDDDADLEPVLVCQDMGSTRSSCRCRETRQ